MTTPHPSPPPASPRPAEHPSRLRSLIVFFLALIYAFLAALIARRAAHGFTSGDWLPLLDRLVFLFLLLVGFAALALAFRSGGARSISAVSGLALRPTAWHEFGTGAAAGWALLLLTVLPAALIGGLQVTVWTSLHQWFLLFLDVAVLAAASLCSEVVFRGYPFEQLRQAIGTSLASVVVSLCCVAVLYRPEMPRAEILALFLLSLLLCVARVRTGALWVSWGLHFAWNAAAGPLFGLPLAGSGTESAGFTPVIQSLPLGPEWATGGDSGPQGSPVAVLVLLFVGLWLVLRVTRDYSHRYGFPEVVPGGIPVDIDAAARRQHEAAMGADRPSAAPRLVQIAEIPPAAAPPRPEGTLPGEAFPGGGPATGAFED